jgi:hypothetical protein
VGSKNAGEWTGGQAQKGHELHTAIAARGLDAVEENLGQVPDALLRSGERAATAIGLEILNMRLASFAQGVCGRGVARTQL